MPAKRKPARVKKWRGRWTLFFWDHAANVGRRVACETLGARNGEERRELVRDYQSREANEAAEVRRRGGLLAYDTRLLEALEAYRRNLQERVQARLANPEARAGIAPATLENASWALSHFAGWLKATQRHRLTTGRLDRSVLDRYFEHAAGETTACGARPTLRSAATLNAYRRVLRGAFRWLDGLRPPLFPDLAALAPAFKPLRCDPRPPTAFAPADLVRFLEAAIAWEDPERRVEVARFKGGKAERFRQGVSLEAATPVSRLFMLLALGGLRRGEALALRWEDVDLDRGRLTVHAQKTGRTRIVPLVGAPEGDVAPRFAALLKRWKVEAGGRVYVLPHGDLEAPGNPKGPWRGIAKASKVRLSPQSLRENFASYAASLGIPAPVCALWQGHGLDVAERFYRAQVLDRNAGPDFEAAMGLGGILDRLLGREEQATEAGA